MPSIPSPQPQPTQQSEPEPGHVHEAMSTVVLTIGPAHTLRQAAQLMSARRVGAAIVLDPETSGLGILTERDILNSLGAGEDPDHERAHDHTTRDVVFATPSWSLDKAAQAMTRGGFRHLIVLDDGGPVGVVSVRDIMRRWSVTDVPRMPEGPEPHGVRSLRVGSAS